MTDSDSISEYYRELQSEQETLRYGITTIMWSMRGSLSREEAWTLSPEERNDMMTIMKERKELTEKTGLPLL